MAPYKNRLTLTVLLLTVILLSCENSVEPSQLPSLSPKQEQLINTIWVYNALIIESKNGTGLVSQADQNMEPICGPVGSLRNLINKRRVRYTRDGTYELLWEPRGEYELGTPGDLNFQPSFGSYQLNTQGTRLIHSVNQDHEVVYTEVKISDELFERTSKRVMALDSHPECFQFQYQKGDTITFIEQFVSIDF